MSHAELIERLEKATGPDREIDALICVALRDAPNQQHYKLAVRRPPSVHHADWQVDLVLAPIGTVRSVTPPAYTASLDVVCSLVERLLPGLSPLVGVDHNYGFDNDIPGFKETPRWNAWCYGQSGEHPTSPAIALLIALLRAL